MIINYFLSGQKVILINRDEFKIAMETAIIKDFQLEQSRLVAGQEIRHF